VNGETRTGVTTMRIDAGLDTGDMLLKAETEIDPNENAVALGTRLAVMGASLLVTTLDGLARGTITPARQDNAQATLAPLIKKEDGRIDWTRSAVEIHNRVRGLQPWPGAQTGFRGQPLHIWKSQVGDSDPSLTVGAPIGGEKSQVGDGERAPAPPGQIVGLKPLAVSTGTGVLELLEVQLEGRKRIPANDFANGQRLMENEMLGELSV
jgi:methionyl-tRNA formyltransferase